MSNPHPTDDDFAAAYGEAWTKGPEQLLSFFAPEGTYTDVAMGNTYTGHSEIARFQRFMLKFAPDSIVEFGDSHTAGDRLHMEWTWTGSFAAPLRLRSGELVDATGGKFAVPGIAACRFDRTGKLTQHRDFWDLATVLDQASVPIG